MKHWELLLVVVCVSAAQPESARKLSDQALAAYRSGAYGTSERLNREAIAKWEGLGADFAPHLAITRMNLGNTLGGEGRREEGRDELRQALALFRRSVGVRNLNTLTCINLLAAQQLMWNDTEDAGRLLEEALPIERELYPGDVQLARTLSEFATLRLRQGRSGEALPPAEEGLSLALKVSGEDSLDAAFGLGVVAEVHRMSQRPDRALPLYRRARDLYEKHLGPAHPRVADMLAQEAAILMGDNKLALAEQELKRALAILDRTCPDCIFEHWMAEEKLGLVYLRRNKYAAADRLLSDALALEEKINRRPSPEMLETLRSLALVRQKEHRFEDADHLNQQAAGMSL